MLLIVYLRVCLTITGGRERVRKMSKSDSIFSAYTMNLTETWNNSNTNNKQNNLVFYRFFKER